MFFNGKRALGQSTEGKNAIAYATEAADSGGCPSGVYTRKLSYSEIMETCQLIYQWRALYKIPQKSIAQKFPFRARPVVRKCRMGWNMAVHTKWSKCPLQQKKGEGASKTHSSGPIGPTLINQELVCDCACLPGVRSSVRL